MNKYICIGILFLLSTSVFSNDSSVVLGSSVKIIDNENPNITMLEEEIIITLYKRYYEVDVTFDFYNDGNDETLLLGFPVWTATYDTPEEREWAKIKDFQSYINGELITEYDIITEESKSHYLETTTWFIREVTFTENNHTYSRVTYKAPYNSFGYKSGAGYIYGTGRSWKDSIGKMTVIIKHGDNELIEDVSFGWRRTFDELIWDANGTYRYILNNIEPDERENITIYMRRYNLFGKYDGQFGENWDGYWIWDRSLIEKTNKTSLYTRNQIKLFISFFYAMHGYIFENQLLKTYFQNMPLSWANERKKYEEDPNFSEKLFNMIESKNIDYLLSLERMIPSEEDPTEFDTFLELLIEAVEADKAKEKSYKKLEEKEIVDKKTEDKSSVSIQNRIKTIIHYVYREGKELIIFSFLFIYIIRCLSIILIFLFMGIKKIVQRLKLLGKS